MTDIRYCDQKLMCSQTDACEFAHGVLPAHYKIMSEFGFCTWIHAPKINGRRWNCPGRVDHIRLVKKNDCWKF